jgi:hypothetical protein
MANAGTVNINLVAETAQFVANINKAVSTLKYLKAAEIAFSQGKELAGWIVQQIQMAKEYSKAGTAVADSLDRQAQSLGTTSRAMAAFAVVEHRADLEAGSLASSLSKMQQAISDSQVYGSSADKTFSKLGLRFSDLIGLSLEDQFRMIADAISKVDTASERTAATMDIFGKAGKGLVGTMTDGSKAFDSAAESAKKFGLSLSATEQARILKAEEKVKELAIVIKGYQQQVAAANAENVAAQAALSANREKVTANIAKEVNNIMAKSIDAEAAVIDLGVSLSNIGMTMGGMGYGSIGAAPKQFDRVTDAVKSAREEVKKAGEEAKRTEELSSGMLKVFVDYERQFAAAGVAYGARMKRDAEISKEYAKEAEKKNASMMDQKKILDEMYEVRLKQDEQESKSVKKIQDNYRGAIGVVNKFYEDVASARRKNDEEYRTKSAADDPKVKEAIAKRQLGGGKGDPAIQAELLRIQQERIAIETALGDPSQDPKVLYDRKVQLLLKEEAIRSAEDERKRILMEEQEKRALYSNFFGDLATIAGAFADQSREMFIVSQVASIAQAEINAWMAYSNVLAKESILGVAASQIMASAALAAGQVAVMNIAMQQPPGRATGGAVMRNSLYEVAEKGPEILESGGRSYLLNGDKSGRVQPLGPGGGKSGVVVNVNNLPGQTARVSEGGTPESPTINIDILDGMMANAASQPRGQFSRAMQSQYGLNAARGAR